MAIVGYRLSVFIKNESLNDFAGYDMADSTGGHALHLLPNDRWVPALAKNLYGTTAAYKLPWLRSSRSCTSNSSRYSAVIGTDSVVPRCSHH